MPATGWTCHDAAVLVARQQHIPAAERRELMAMLGLLNEAGTAVGRDATTDEARAVDGAVFSQINSNSPMPEAPIHKLGARQSSDGPPPGGKYCPPGLRRVIEGGAPEPPPAKPKEPAPIKKTPAKKKLGQSGGRPRPPCGGPNGARAHKRRGEPICEPCKEGRRKADRESKRRNYVPKPPRETPLSPCGTKGAYMRHWRLKEKCDVCRLAYNERRAQQRERARQRAAAQAA